MKQSLPLFTTTVCIALVILGVCSEIWFAPIRPGAWSLALKMLPLALSLPALARGRRRAYQWWSMGMLAYFAEGIVRATSDTGPSVPFAWAQTALATLAWVAILAFAYQPRTRR